jgi:fused signal recognition particle receptor
MTPDERPDPLSPPQTPKRPEPEIVPQRQPAPEIWPQKSPSIPEVDPGREPPEVNPTPAPNADPSRSPVEIPPLHDR